MLNLDRGLRDKVVVVTGAAQGLGKATAQAFATEGARLGLLDSKIEGARDAAREIGDGALPVEVDVANDESVAAAVAMVFTTWHRIDILVHCAGIARGPTQMGDDGWLPMETVTLADWQTVVGVNLTGTFLMNRAVAGRMLTQNWGRIINVASISALVANRGLLGLGPYSASKGGVLSLTRVLAAEWATRGVTVNSISPGYMATEMGTLSQRFPGFKELQLSLIPQGRLGKSSEFAQAALYLASDGAAHVTGQNLVIDGGYTVW